MEGKAETGNPKHRKSKTDRSVVVWTGTGESKSTGNKCEAKGRTGQYQGHIMTFIKALSHANKQVNFPGIYLREHATLLNDNHKEREKKTDSLSEFPE